MKTTKPISSISYCSLQYTIDRLEELLREEKISFYALIEHQPEEDEKKSHIHLFVVPSIAIDLEGIRKRFLELDPTNDKPKSTLLWVKSKFVDWYYYSLHDVAYLASKNMSRKYHYERYDVLSSDDEQLDNFIRENPRPKSEFNYVLELIKKGYDDFEIMKELQPPLSRWDYTLRAIELIRRFDKDKTERNGKPNHEEDTKEQGDPFSNIDVNQW